MLQGIFVNIIVLYMSTNWLWSQKLHKVADVVFVEGFIWINDPKK
jgi:hypothetical protein